MQCLPEAIINNIEWNVFARRNSSVLFWQTCCAVDIQVYKQTNSIALVPKRIIPTEWPPLVSEVTANSSR
jgi:hypothetical protein